MLRYLPLDIICSSKLTVFLEHRSRKTVRFWEQKMSADKYLSIFSRQMEAIVYITPTCVDICPPIISIEKKQSQWKKASSKVSPFHLYYFTWKKNKLVS